MKKDKKEKDESEQQNRFSDKLDLYGFMADVKMRIRNNITSDFVMAKVGDKDKKAIIEIERVRRITGYLTGDTNKWGSAKQAELKDRVKHT